MARYLVHHRYTIGRRRRNRNAQRPPYPVSPGILYPPARLVGEGWTEAERDRIAGVPGPMNQMLANNRPTMALRPLPKRIGASGSFRFAPGPSRILLTQPRPGATRVPVMGNIGPAGRPGNLLKRVTQPGAVIARPIRRPVNPRTIGIGQAMPFAKFRSPAGGPDFQGTSAQVSFPRPGVQPIVSEQDYQSQVQGRIAGIQNPYDVTMAQLPGMRRVQSQRAMQESQQIGSQLQRQAKAQMGTQLDYQRNLMEGMAGLQRANQFMDIAQRLFQSNTNLGRLRRQTSLAELARRLWLLGVLG